MTQVAKRPGIGLSVIAVVEPRRDLGANACLHPVANALTSMTTLSTCDHSMRDGAADALSQQRQDNPPVEIENRSLMVIVDRYQSDNIARCVQDAVGGETVRVTSLEQALVASSRTPFNVIMVEANLAGAHGFAALRARAPHAALIAVCDITAPTSANAARLRGADDCIFDGPHAPFALAGMLRSALQRRLLEYTVNAQRAQMQTAFLSGDDASVKDKTVLSNVFALDHEIRAAMSGNALELHYQPVVDITTGTLVSMEALLRLQRQGGRLALPAEFMPAAEQSELIMGLDDWVLEAACRDNLRWQADGAKNPVTAVNISAQQFFSPDLTPTLDALLKRSALPGTSLQLEVAESTLLLAPEQGISVLKRLRDMDVQVTIDGFGSVHGSLRYLQKFPASTLKLPPELGSRLEASASARAIVSGIVTVAKTLGIRVVAGGLETATHLEWAKHFECDAAQGFVIARPLRTPQMNLNGAMTSAHDANAVRQID